MALSGETRVKHEKSVVPSSGHPQTPLIVNGSVLSNGSVNSNNSQQRPIRPRTVVAPAAAAPVAATATDPQTSTATPAQTAVKPVSSLVQFSYSEIDGATIPKIYRCIHGEQVAYVVVRMVELKLLWRFPNNYPDELKKRPPLRSSYMTEDEGALINEINEAHCLNEYGKHDYSKRDNMLVKFDEFMDFYDAVRRCYSDIAANRCVGITLDELNQMKGGFLQINNTVCPFVYRKEIKFVPYTYLHSCGMNIGLDSTSGFGFYPSPKECAFFNSVSPRLTLKVQMGMLSKMMSLDMIEKLTDCVVRDLNIHNPFGSTQYMPNQNDIRLAGQIIRQQQQQQQQHPQHPQAALFNVMAVNRPTMISVAPLVSGPGGTFTTTNGIPVLSSAQLLQTPIAHAAQQAPARPPQPSQQQQQLHHHHQVTHTPTAAAAAAVGPGRPRAQLYQHLQQQQQQHQQQQPRGRPPAPQLQSRLAQSPQQHLGGTSVGGPSDPKRRRTDLNVAVATSLLQPPPQQLPPPSPNFQRQPIKESPLGTCSLLKVQGDITGGRAISLCIIRPYIALLPENAIQGDYVVLDHVRRTLFPAWSADRLLTVLQCVVPATKIYRIAEGLAALFEEAFSFRVTSRENALLHAESLLKNLPFLQIRYAEMSAGAHPAMTAAPDQHQGGRIALRPATGLATGPVANANPAPQVLANITAQQLQQQQQRRPQQQQLTTPFDVIQIDD